jgi:diguanylate cyclase (GGDEF)-like protein
MTDNRGELETRLKQAQTDKDKIDALNELAWYIRQTEPERALSLSQEAREQSTSGEYSSAPYRLGLSTCLTTLGYLNRQRGKMDLALSQCIEAIEILDTLPPSRVSIDCRRIITWIYYFVGDQTTALKFGIQALHLSQELNLHIQEATVLDVLAMIYAASGDQEQALKSNGSATQIARTAGDELLEITTLNNRAYILHQSGSSSEALEPALQGLKLAHQSALVVQESSILDTLGEILIAMGDYVQAEKYLREGLTLLENSGLGLDKTYYSLGLGKLYLKLPDLEQARTQLEQALDLATSSNMQAIGAECHHLLAEVHERQGDYKQALEHQKSYDTLHEKINNESSAKQLAILKVAHQVETAQRDSEIYRLLNVELRGEIEERKRIEKELEFLATIDPLTCLYNRRHFFKLAQHEIDLSLRYNRPLTMLMVDLDHFKDINDSYGHATGDQVLGLVSAFIQKTLRSVDIIGRYGGEEFCIVLPETNLKQGLLAAKRLMRSVKEENFETASGKISLTISIGLSNLPLDNQTVKVSIDQLLDNADKGLYKAKQTGRNRVETYLPDELTT